MDANLQDSYFEGYKKEVDLMILLLLNFKGKILHSAITTQISVMTENYLAFRYFNIPNFWTPSNPPGMPFRRQMFLSYTELKKGMVVEERKKTEVH